MPGALDDLTVRHLADNLPTLCWIARGDGYIVWYNRRWHEYCGTTRDQMEGWGWQAVHDPTQLPNVIQQWTHSITTGEPFEMMFPLKGADGTFRPFLTRAQPMKDASGTVVRWFGVNSDVSDQLAAEALLRAERDRSTGIVEAMSEGLLLLDWEFRVLDINSEGLRIDGRSRDAIVGKLHCEAWPGTEHSEQVKLYKQVMAERISLSTEVHHTWEDGHDAWVEVRAFPHPEGISIFFRNISDRKRAEMALRDSEAFTRLMLDSTSEAFYAVDTEGKTTLCNDAFLRILGFESRDAVLGRKLHDVIHHSHQDGSRYPSHECPIYHAAAHGISAVVTNEVFFRLDGVALSVEYKAEPIIRNGELLGAICTFSDISERLIAEKTKALFIALSDRLHLLSSPIEIVKVTVEMLGQHLGVSRVGFGKVESDDQTITYEIDYVDGVDHLIGKFPIDNFGRANIAALRAGETTTYADLTMDPRTQDADWAAIETRSAMAVPLVRGNRLKAILYLNHRDIREWTAAEIALVQDVATRTWDALERVYAEESLRKIAANLSEANHRKTEFLATLAHELRNPLAPIRTGLELMRVGDDKPETVKRVRIMMERQIGNMVHLIDDLLDVARINSGKIKLKRELVTLRQIVTGAVETSIPVIESKLHQLVIDLPTEELLLNADSVRLTQVFSNLLTNAAKYTPSNGKLSLVAVTENDEAVIRVSDNGVGIAEESLTQVFEMFAQINSNIERAQGGLGIGLSLVHRLIEMHEGTVIATSQGIGQGSTFIVRLPLANTDDLQLPENGQTQSVLGDEPNTLEILVADDNEDAADMLARLLQIAGHKVRLANDGQHAVSSALANKPDVAIIDIGMPGLNGYEVARALRKIPEMQKTVLIALTGWGSAEDLKATTDAGFNHHLTKPIQIKKIEAILAMERAAM
ncbi:MAG: PAS domain S-box protein [Pseudomonadota bacterium]